MVAFRDARREEVPQIVALLADDVLGAGREGLDDDAYLAAFDQIEAVRVAAARRGRGLGQADDLMGHRGGARAGLQPGPADL